MSVMMMMMIMMMMMMGMMKMKMKKLYDWLLVGASDHSGADSNDGRALEPEWMDVDADNNQTVDLDDQALDLDFRLSSSCTRMDGW